MAPVPFISEPFTYPGGGIAAGVLVKVAFANTLVLAPIYHDSLGVRAPNPVRTDDDGVIVFYAEPGDYDLIANGAVVPIAVTGVGSGDAAYPYMMSVGGSGGPGVGQAPIYNNTGRDQVVVGVRVSALDSGGGGVVIDVNIDDVTIYPDPDDRPGVPVASGRGTTYEPCEAILPDGSYLTVDVDSGTFNNLVVQIFVR